MMNRLKKVEKWIKRNRGPISEVKWMDERVNGGHGICLDALTGGNHFYVEDKRAGVSHLAGSKHVFIGSSVSRHGYTGGFIYNISMPALSSEFLDAGGQEITDPPYQQSSGVHLPDVTYVSDYQPVWSMNHQQFAFAYGADTVNIIPGCAGLTHRLHDLKIDGTFYTRYIQASADEGVTSSIDPIVEPNMENWDQGNGVRIMLVQEWMRDQDETHGRIQEDDIVEVRFQDKGYFEPQRDRFLQSEEKQSDYSGADLETADNDHAFRSRKFHVLYKKDIYHGNTGLNKYDLRPWQTKFKLHIPFHRTKYSLVQYKPVHSPSTGEVIGKMIQNPIYLMVLPMLPDNPSTGLRYTAAQVRPHLFFKGNIVARHTDEIWNHALGL
jgi:hypothetical protein